MTIVLCTMQILAIKIILFQIISVTAQHDMQKNSMFSEI